MRMSSKILSLSLEREEDRPREIPRHRRAGRSQDNLSGSLKANGLIKNFPLAFVFILLGFTLCTLTIVEAGISGNICVQWNPIYGGSPACGTSGEVGGCMTIKLVVKYTPPVIEVTNGWIKFYEIAGHPDQSFEMSGLPPTAPTCQRCQPGWPGEKVKIFAQDRPPYAFLNCHNGPWKIEASCDYIIPAPPPNPPIIGQFKTETTITLRNLAVQNISPKYLIWSPDYPASNQLTIQYSLDSVQQTPVNVTIKILPLSDNQNPDPIKTVLESRTSPDGPYTYTWDGTMDTSVPPGQPAPKGIYPFEISVSQPAPPYTQDQKTSAYLTISNVSVEGVPCDATDYVKVKVKYTLSDTKGHNATACWIRVYNPRMEFIGVEPGEPGDATLGGHEKELTLLKSAVGWGGLYTFVVRALDDNDIYEKGHRDKPAIEKGKKIYNKILDVPHYYQTGDLDGDGAFDEDDIDHVDNDGDGRVDEDPWKRAWCGEATAKMWIDYKNGFNTSDYNRHPTQLEIAQWVLNTFGPQDAEDRNGDGDIDPEERAIKPLEYGRKLEGTDVSCPQHGVYEGALNHFLRDSVPDCMKYHRYVLESQDDMIGREADLIANYHEPSAAVCELDPPGDPNDPSDQAWHWLLVVGCVADGWPGAGGINIFGLWIHDPGWWFTPIPAYVSSDIWKQKYFESCTDRDGASGYTHVEDPPPEYNHLRPVRCEPPTRPQGAPVSLQQVQQIAQEGIELHLLNFTGALAPYLQQAQIGTPVLVRALNPRFGDYYLVPYLQAGKVTAIVIVDAATGQFHGATACTAGWAECPPISSEQARRLALARYSNNIQHTELVWGFCEEAPSPYTPLWRVTYEDGETRFISQKGTVHRQLTRHSCVEEGLR